MRFDIEIDDRQAVRALAELRRRGESMEPALRFIPACAGNSWIGLCQWQSKTAHFWQLKTAHVEGGSAGWFPRRWAAGILERVHEVVAGFASRSASDCRCMERRSSWCWRIR